MAKDQKIKKLSKKIDLLHSHFTTRLIEKEKEIYAKIIDYFSKLGHDMHLLNQALLDETAMQSEPTLIIPKNVKKAKVATRVKKITAPKASTKPEVSKKLVGKKAGSKKNPVKAVSLKTAK